MTIADQIKIINRTIMQKEAEYDLDRKAAKISALSSDNLDKYEYLTAEDLGLKPSTVEQDKFEHSALVKIFNKKLNAEEDRKEGLFKRLKQIEDLGRKQLDKDSRSLKAIDYFSQLSAKLKELYVRIKKEKNDIDLEKFVCVKTDGIIFNFNKFRNSLDLA